MCKFIEFVVWNELVQYSQDQIAKYDDSNFNKEVKWNLNKNLWSFQTNSYIYLK